MANSIIIRSEKCNDELQKAIKGATGSVCLTTAMLAVLSFVIICWRLIMAKISGQRIYVSEAVSPVGAVFGLLLLILSVVYLVVMLGMIVKKSKEYQEYLNVEALNVCEQNVYGTTVAGDLSLTYDQIDSVRVYPSNKDKNKKGIALTVLNNLEIRDKSGRLYTFYTLKNAGEIKTAIDHQKNNI